MDEQSTITTYEDESFSSHPLSDSINSDHLETRRVKCLKYKETNGQLKKIQVPEKFEEPFFEYKKCDVYDNILAVKCTLCYSLFHINFDRRWTGLYAHLGSDRHKELAKKFKENQLDVDDQKSEESLKSTSSVKGKRKYVESNEENFKVLKIIKYRDSNNQIKELNLHRALEEPYFEFENRVIYDEIIKIKCTLCYKMLHNNCSRHWGSLHQHLRSDRHKRNLENYQNNSQNVQIIQQQDENEEKPYELRQKRQKLISTNDITINSTDQTVSNADEMSLNEFLNEIEKGHLNDTLIGHPPVEVIKSQDSMEQHSGLNNCENQIINEYETSVTLEQEESNNVCITDSINRVLNDRTNEQDLVTSNQINLNLKENFNYGTKFDELRQKYESLKDKYDCLIALSYEFKDKLLKIIQNDI